MPVRRTRRFARDFAVDLGGTGARHRGPAGRVSQDDVKNYLRVLAAGGGPGGGFKAPPIPNFEQWGSVSAKPFESIRKATADHLSMCWNCHPACHPARRGQNVTDIEAVSQTARSRKGPGKLTVTAFVLKACAILLKQYPQFNASLDTEKQQLIYKNYYHLGIAVDTERGLVVPKLRDVDKKSVYDLGKEMTEMAERGSPKRS